MSHKNNDITISTQEDIMVDMMCSEEEIDFSGVFDIEGEEPEVADPEETEEPAAETAEGEEPEVADPEEPEVEKKPQSPEENAKFAEIRRKYEAERDAAVKAAEEAAQKRIDENIAALHIVDPFSNEKVDTKEKYDIYKQQRYKETEEKAKQALQGSEVTLDDVINNHPVVMEARKALDELAVEKARLQGEEAQIRVNADLETIKQMDPTITKIEDIAKNPNKDKVFKLIQKGYSLADAYFVANRDKLLSTAAAKAEKAAVTKAASKEHMTHNKSAGDVGAEMPSDVMAECQKFMPDMTPDEIRQWYVKSQAKSKKKG